MKLNILTSKLYLALIGICIGDIAIILQFALYGLKFSFFFLGIYLSLWGAMSVGIIIWEKATPDHPGIPKWKTIGNISLIITFLFIMLSILASV